MCISAIQLCLLKNYRTVEYDIDENNDAADEAGVKSIPTFLIYVDGKEAWRHSGEIDGDILLTKVESFL
nr:thioredoxin family protein [uncultured Duncaniella sp.]